VTSSKCYGVRMKKNKPAERNLVSVDIGNGLDEVIAEIVAADPITSKLTQSRRRGPVIKAALAIGLPLLLAQVKGAK